MTPRRCLLLLGGTLLVVGCAGLVARWGVPTYQRARHEAHFYGCSSCLAQIVGAKESWAQDRGVTSNAVPTAEDISVYIKKGFSRLKCPDGGAYSIGTLEQYPSCSYEDAHVRHGLDGEVKTAR